MNKKKKIVKEEELEEESEDEKSNSSEDSFEFLSPNKKSININFTDNNTNQINLTKEAF